MWLMLHCIPQARMAEAVGMGPTIGTHVGPGAFGIMYIRKQ